MDKSKIITNAWGHLALLAIALVPSALGYSAYLTDLPNGILRIALELKLLADPGASSFYSFAPVLIPNMTLDSWGLVVGPWLGPEGAVSALVALSVVLIYTAVQALRVASVGQSSLLAGAIALLVIQSGVFRWGLVNYEIGVGLALWAMALSEASDRRGGLAEPGPLALRSLLGLLSVTSSIFPIVILSCHAGGRLLLMLRKGLSSWSWPTFWGLSAPMIAPVLFLAAARKRPPGEEFETAWTLYGKISGWVSLFYVRGPGLELPLAFAFAAMLLIVVTTLRGRIDARLQPFLWLMLLAYILVPSRLFSVDAVDYRLAQPMALVALGAMRFSQRTGGGWERWGRGVTAAFMLVAAAKSFVSIESLAPIRGLRLELTRDLEPVPAGSKILVATSLPDFRFQGHRIWHLPLLSLADLGRDIYGPSLFSNFFLHEKQRDEIPDWLDVAELQDKPIVCTATHVVLIGDVTGVAAIAKALPANIVSSSEHAAVFALDQPGCASRHKAVPVSTGWLSRDTPGGSNAG